MFRCIEYFWLFSIKFTLKHLLRPKSIRNDHCFPSICVVRFCLPLAFARKCLFLSNTAYIWFDICYLRCISRLNIRVKEITGAIRGLYHQTICYFFHCFLSVMFHTFVLVTSSSVFFILCSTIHRNI